MTDADDNKQDVPESADPADAPAAAFESPPDEPPTASTADSTAAMQVAAMAMEHGELDAAPPPPAPPSTYDSPAASELLGSPDVTPPPFVMDEVMVSFSDVSFQPEGLESPIVESMSFSLKEKRRILIVGGFHSGKSSLLRLAFGAETPTSGTVKLMGEDVSTLEFDQLQKIRRHIGYMPERGALLSNITLYDNLVLPLRYHTEMTEEEVRLKADAALKMMHQPELPHLLPPLTDRCTRRKVSIARTLVREPKLLILDDPTEDFDIGLARRLWACIKTISEELNVAVLATANESTPGEEFVDQVIRLESPPHLAAPQTAASGVQA